MSAQINENTQYTDPATGELLNNGFVYIGENNLDAKLNPKAIYADRELTTALLNPQRTGSDGRVENKIWVDGKYSLKVENSENVQKLIDPSLGELATTNNTTLTNVQGTDSLTAEGNPAVTALVNNQVYIFTAANTNTGAMTLTIDLTTTWPIKKQHDKDMVAGDIEGNQTVALIWNETDSVFELMTNSAIEPVDLASVQTITGNKTFSGATTLSGTNTLSGTTTISGPTTLSGATTAISGVATNSNLVNLAAGANIASAATVDLTAATGNSPRITGATATSAVTMNTGQQMLVVADGAWPLTYHATTNKLNGGVSYTCAAGDMVLYNKDLSGVVHGLIIRVDGEAVVETNPLTSGTAVATTSGTSIDFTGIPSWAKKITILLDGVSTNGIDYLTAQIGDSGGIEATGYLGQATHLPSGSAIVGSALSVGFSATFGFSPAYTLFGKIELNLIDSSTNTWIGNVMTGFVGTNSTIICSGSKSLSGTLDRVRLTSGTGTDTFDAGTMNIIYE